MHIAICDDNIADRKHLERLLSRESDKRAGTPNILYIESFGRKDNLLKNPLKYDLFFIDMVSEPNLAHDTVLELKRLGVTAPIVMFSSSIDYSADVSLPEDIIHRSKPYIPDPLPELLALGDKHVTGLVASIQVNINGLIVAVPVNDIYYAISENNDTRLYLKDGQTTLVNEPFVDICKHVEPYEEFYYLNRKTLVNLKFTTLVTPFTIVMMDYKTFHYPFWYYSEILELKEKIERTY